MDILRKTLLDFVIDYSEYLPGSIPELYKIPNSHQFLSDYVITNVPFVFRSRIADKLPAVSKWDDKVYLRKLMYEKKVTVAVTPNGRADSIVDNRFMLPEERTMLFEDFHEEFLKPDPEQVYYLQKQNNNLIEEFSPLVKDVMSHVPWATEAFGHRPDAANIWMGDGRSVSSIHKDHYENIYYVITGSKKFYLFPPVAMSWMPYQKCKKFQWYFEGEKGLPGKWHMKDLNEEVKWILPSHQPQTPEDFTMFHNTKSYAVDVFPGDFLYIPALWFHEVHQKNRTIAVNYWYDMKYDMKYPFLKLLTKLCKIPISRRDASVDKQDELEDSLFDDLYVKKKKFVQEELNKNVTYHKHDKYKK